MLTLIADKIVSVGLALIDEELVSVLTLIVELVSMFTWKAEKIVPISLALIAEELVSLLTLIADELHLY